MDSSFPTCALRLLRMRIFPALFPKILPVPTLYCKSQNTLCSFVPRGFRTMFPPPGMFTSTFVIWLTPSPSRFCSSKKHYPLPKTPTMGYVWPQAPDPCLLSHSIYFTRTVIRFSYLTVRYLKVESVTFIPMFPEPSIASDIY